MNIPIKENTELAIIITNEPQDSPFVNEECGDTMWEPVLKELEDRLANAIRKPSDPSAETGDKKPNNATLVTNEKLTNYKI